MALFLCDFHSPCLPALPTGRRALEVARRHVGATFRSPRSGRPSGRIIDSRECDGPFASVDELLERDLISLAVFDEIVELVTAGLAWPFFRLNVYRPRQSAPS